MRGTAGYSGSNAHSTDGNSLAKLCGICVLFVMLCVAVPIFYHHHQQQQQQQQHQHQQQKQLNEGSRNAKSRSDTMVTPKKEEGTSSTISTKTATVTTTEDDSNKVHIVFSTDCSSFQHWQSYLLFYSAYRIHQPGKITRIASGCTDEEEEKELAWHTEHISSVMSEDFRIHFTPHFSAVKDESGKVNGDYKFFNKPMGLKHWFENSPDMGVDGNKGTVLPEHEDTIIALLDPDQVLLKHISGDMSDLKLTLVSNIAKDGRKFKVEHGTPFGQHYGLGEYSYFIRGFAFTVQ